MYNHSHAGQPQVDRWFFPLFFTVFIIVMGLGSACGRATEKPIASSNDPDQLLRLMSETLARAKTLSVKVNRKLDAGLVEDTNIPEDAQIEISVSRPGKFLAKLDSKDYVRRLVFDGQSFSIYDETMKLYVSVPIPGTIDDLVAKIDEKYGFKPPLAEFILSDPYAALGPQMKTKEYSGKETVDGVECHHLTLSGEIADSELWIGVADLLPRKLVATFKDRDGGPALQADFSNWNLAATLDDKNFAFVAPQDAERVEMVTDAQMKEAAEKAPQE